jgi:hypothetical protein
MSYALLLALLVFQAEKLPNKSLKIILIGMILTPIVGFIYLNFQKGNYKEAI